jgi:hypothetical protein
MACIQEYLARHLHLQGELEPSQSTTHGQKSDRPLRTVSQSLSSAAI